MDRIDDPYLLPGVTSHIEVDPMTIETRLKTTQDCEPVLDGIKGAQDVFRKDSGLGVGARFVGSIPIIVAQAWAKECGYAIGTAGFAEHVRKKLADSNNARLLVHGY